MFKNDIETDSQVSFMLTALSKLFPASLLPSGHTIERTGIDCELQYSLVLRCKQLAAGMSIGSMDLLGGAVTDEFSVDVYERRHFGLFRVPCSVRAIESNRRNGLRFTLIADHSPERRVAAKIEEVKIRFFTSEALIRMLPDKRCVLIL